MQQQPRGLEQAPRQSDRPGGFNGRQFGAMALASLGDVFRNQLGSGGGGQGQLMLQFLLRQQLEEQRAYQAQQEANREGKQANTAALARQDSLTAFADANNLTPQQRAALAVDPDTFMTNWAQMYRPQSASPGEQIHMPNGNTITGAPRYQPIVPGGMAVNVDALGGQNSGETLTDEDIERMYGTGGSGGNAAGGFPRY